MLLASGPYALIGIVIVLAICTIYNVIAVCMGWRIRPPPRPAGSVEMGVELNVGGFIGAACGAVLGSIIAYALSGPHIRPKDFGRVMGLAFVGGLIVCALAGNAAWRWFFRNSPSQKP